MQYIIIFLFGIALLKILFDSFVLNKGIVNSYRWVKSELNNAENRMSCNASPLNFLLLIPVYREQKNISKIFDYFSRLNCNGKYKVVFVVSEDETPGENDDKTTLEHISLHIDNYNRNYADSLFSCVICPYKNANKAKKLNYALDYLRKETTDFERTYIGVYDADSKPDLNTLPAIENQVSKYYKKTGKYPIAFQQPSYFTKNIGEVGLYMKLEAIFQTRWCFGHEIRTQLLSCRNNKYKVPYAYCVGHGMFIKYDFLTNNCGFPEPSEDVPMGFRLDIMNIPIIPIWVFDCAEVVASIKFLLIQSGKWAKNAFLVFHEIRKMHQLKLKTNLYREIVLGIKGVVDVFSWIHYLMCFVTSVILSLRYESFLFVGIFLAAAFVDSGIGTAIMCAILKDSLIGAKQKKLCRFLQITSLILLSPIRGIVRGLAPFLAIFSFVKEAISGNRKSKNVLNSN